MRVNFLIRMNTLIDEDNTSAPKGILKPASTAESTVKQQGGYMALRELSWAEESSRLKCLLFPHTSISTFWNISPRFSWLIWEIQKGMESASFFISLTDELWKNKQTKNQPSDVFHRVQRKVVFAVPRY